jgi:hypothetical protein
MHCAPSRRLFRKKARTERLGPCKRGPLTPLAVLPPFCGAAEPAARQERGTGTRERGCASFRRFAGAPGMHCVPSRRLFRKKARTERLGPCKRGPLTPLAVLPPFCGSAGTGNEAKRR